jgi:hypothetical protein
MCELCTVVQLVESSGVRPVLMGALAGGGVGLATLAKLTLDNLRGSKAEDEPSEESILAEPTDEVPAREVQGSGSPAITQRLGPEPTPT